MNNFFKKIIHLETKFRSYILIFLVLLLYTQLYSPLIEKLIIDKIAPFLKFNNSYWGDAAFGILVIGAFVAVIAKVRVSFLEKMPKIEDLIWPVLIILVYSVHRFRLLENSSWYFLSFKSIWFLKYTDGLILLSLFLIYNPKSYLKEQEKFEGIPELYEDNFNQRNGGADIFKRTEYAKYISKLILNQTTQTSFAIGVRGSWGSGKSVFLGKIENEIQNAIKIRFNPWLSKSTDEVLGDFFKILVDRISEYDSGLSRSFRKYYSTLINLDENYFKKIFVSIGLIKGDQGESLEKQQKGIIDQLNKNKLRIVIFIDDLDRLNAEEILSVLKLIRNSFNFPNTYFLVAYDHKYITNTLRKVIDNPENFLEKIFQLDIDLPSFPLDLIQKQLIELLSLDKTDAQKNKISEAIKIIGESDILITTVRNLRDAIRFSNSFNHIYQKKESEIDHFDFILLELLKIKNRAIYDGVRTSLISDSNADYIQLPESLSNESEVIHFVATENLDQNHPAYQLMDMLFNRTSNYDPVKSIRIAGNSIRYFSDDLFGVISYVEFEKYKADSFDGFKALIDGQHKTNNLDELASKILRVNFFTDKNSFFNLNKGLLHVCNLKKDYSFITPVYNNLKSNYSKLKTLIPDSDEFSKYIETLFSDSDSDSLSESQVLGQVLSISLEINQQADLPEYDLELIKEILIKNLNQFIEKHKTMFDPLVFDIYYSIIERKTPDKIFINSRASSILRDYILNNQATYFQKWLLRRKYSGTIEPNMYVLEPFIDQYLGYGEFERLLFSQRDSNEILSLKGFFRKFQISDYTAAEYFPNQIEIVSDSETVFIGSPDFPQLKNGKSIIRRDKLIYSDRYSILSGANWIADQEMPPLDHQESGGIYKFKKQFSLEGLDKKIKSAKIYFLVDDFLRMEVNGKKVDNDTEYTGIDQPPNEVNLTEYLNVPENEIIFSIRNTNYERAILEREPGANPYDFIYKIVIETE